MESARSFAPRTAQEALGLDFRRTMSLIDWKRLHIQAVGRHSRVHDGDDIATCGDCIFASLVDPIERSDPPDADRMPTNIPPSPFSDFLRSSYQ